MKTKLLLILSLFVGITLFILTPQLIPQPNSYSEFENKVCIQDPTIECINETILKYGIHNIKQPLHRMMDIPVQYNNLLDDQFNIIKEDFFQPFDPSIVEEHYGIGIVRVKFARALVKKIIQNSEYGASYPFYDGGSKTLTNFLNTQTFKNFEITPTFLSVIDYWTNNAKKLENNDKNDHLLQILNIWVRLEETDQAKTLLYEMRNLSASHSFRYISLLKHLKNWNIEFSVDPQIVVPRYRAELLTLLNKKDEAITLLLSEKQKIITDFEEKNYETKPLNSLKRLKAIARLLAKTGDQEEALSIIKQTYDFQKNDIVHRSFISNSEFSSLYRSVDEKQRALNLMEDYINRDDYRTCQSFNTPWQHGECATELVYLGLPEIAYKKAFKACRQSSNCWPIIGMYIAASETGAELPGIKEMANSVSEDQRAHLYLELSVFHFMKKNSEQGNYLLEQALSEVPNGRRNIGTACKIAYVAFSVDRKDLLTPLFKSSIQLIFDRVPEVEGRMRSYKNIVECFKTLEL